MNATSRCSLWCFRQRGARAGLLAVSTAFAIGAVSPVFAAPRVHEVVIEGMQFNPATLEVNQGDTVVWTNRDFFPHNATAEDGAFRSNDLEPGQSWRFRADTKGDFPYFCSLHPTMKATLTVK
ncbi:MAG TPA: cupredoxin family copper-binding protein [Gammaproteobacteria bacterium]|nr:cupredoxin family copper-binding protein [Gammaproteobacteria bacterium]